MASPGESEWRAERLEQMLEFARGSRTERGFGWLTDDGTVDTDRPLELWINARMTYVFAITGDHELAEHGIRALREVFEDPEHGGWFDVEGVQDAKRCYGHDFVLLAGATAAKHGVAGGAELLTDAAAIHAERFWDAKAGRCVEEWSRDWSTLDDYRGANSNMHAVEAYLAAADATGDRAWLDRALLICERIIGVTARAHDWRIVEHFDADWTPLPDFNHDKPDDPFRPFGATPGHGFEWSRLLVQVSAALGDDARPWIVEAAEHLFERAVDDGLDDDHPLLPYTTDWSGEPVVAERFHWVVAEAVQAAETLYDATQQALLSGLVERWWSEIDDHLIDAANGSWIHELSPTLEPSQRTWSGRPDAYHAVNALRGES